MVVLTKLFYVASVDDVVGKNGNEKITLLHLDEAEVAQKKVLLQRMYDAIDFFHEHYPPLVTQQSPRQWIVGVQTFFHRHIIPHHLEHLSGEFAGYFCVQQNKYKTGQTFEKIPDDAVKE